jgi:hypothetical protein
MCSTLIRCPFASMVTALPVTGVTFVGSTNSKPMVQPSRSFRQPLRNPTACGFSWLWRPSSQLPHPELGCVAWATMNPTQAEQRLLITCTGSPSRVRCRL